jgi:glucose-1-phosphate cytidylyltransferase
MGGAKPSSSIVPLDNGMDYTTIKTVILCGGQGTRIRDVADDLPKPMIPIGNQPVLWHIMQLYSRHGINDFVLCLGHKGAAIKDFFLNYRALSSDFTIGLGNYDSIRFHSPVEEDWRVTLAETGELAQTGARLLRVRKYLIDSELFCFTYGDGVSDIDICELIAFHRSHGRIATVTGVRPPGRFGVMRTTSHQETTFVQEFLEKPQTEQGWINGGFFVLDYRVWDYLTEEEDLIFEREPLQRLSSDGQLVMFEHSGFWQPMDTYREWKLLNELWRGGDAPWNRKPCLQTAIVTK